MAVVVLAWLGATAGAAEPPAAGLHTVILVRHGAYAEDDPADPEVGRGLVPIGRKQAELVAQRLAGLPHRPDALRSSTMTRARETAEVIGRALKLANQPTRDLRECTPPVRGKTLTEAEAKEAAACVEQLEAARARWLGPTPARDTVDVVVAHGNVIRYFVVRALGADPETWLGFTSTHTGITVIEIDAAGKEKVVTFNDTGHLPPELATRGGVTPQPPGGLR